MNVTKIPNLLRPKLKEEKDTPRPVKDGLPFVPFTSMIQGSLGTGKTTILCEWIQMLDEELKPGVGSIDKIFYFSPTAKLDSKARLLIDGKHNYEIEVFDDFNMTIFNECCGEVNGVMEKWIMFKKLMKLWKKFVARNYDVDRMSYQEILTLEEMDFKAPDPPYKHGLTPSFVWVFDDLVGNKDLYKPSPRGDFSKWLLMSRHLKCSTIFLSQVFQGGLAKQLRGNLNVIALLRNKSVDAKKSIAMELSSFIEPEKLVELWDYATEKDHDFFLIDVRSKERQFRRNWDEVLSCGSKNADDLRSKK